MKLANKRLLLNIIAPFSIILLSMILTGFILPIQRTQDTPPQHKEIPGSPIGKVMQTVHDQVDNATALQKQAFGGDDYKNGKYERPFTQDMEYLPQADLVSVKLSREDPLWIFVQFKVNAEVTIIPDAITHFLVELDTDLDNRGNYLVVTGPPMSTDWETGSVQVLSNPDLNIGGVDPVKPDSQLSEGRGYYEEIFNNGKGDDPDLAWSRLLKDDPMVVEMAFKNTLTGGEKGKFIWLPWTDIGLTDWSKFEFNDHFTFEQAGYPIKDDKANYPLKAIWGVDNTCREPSNFTPNGTMPGLCPNYDPAPSTSHKETKMCCFRGICTPC
jgi:hypothetical protein